MGDGVCIRRVSLDPEAVDGILEITEGMTLGMETFLEGIPYAQREYVEDPVRFGAMPYAVNYIRSTRQPVEDIRAFVRETRRSGWLCGKNSRIPPFPCTLLLPCKTGWRPLPGRPGKRED